eukprot:3886055-Prymnesium_polylepis.1
MEAAATDMVTPPDMLDLMTPTARGHTTTAAAWAATPPDTVKAGESVTLPSPGQPSPQQDDGRLGSDMASARTPWGRELDEAAIAALDKDRTKNDVWPPGHGRR